MDNKTSCIRSYFISDSNPMAHNKQRNCDICDTQGHMSYLHQTKDYEKRHEIIQQLGYEPFQDWFHEFEFRNWWQSNGRIDVPLGKIPRRIAGNNNTLRDWATQAPIHDKSFSFPDHSISSISDTFPHIGTWPPPENNEAPPNKGRTHLQRTKLDSKPCSRVPPPLLGPFPVIDKWEPQKREEGISKDGPLLLGNDILKLPIGQWQWPAPAISKNENKSPPPTKFSDYRYIAVQFSSPAIESSDPDVCLKWSQNCKCVRVAIDIENVSQEQIDLSYDEKSLTLGIEDNGSRVYFLKIRFAHEIMDNYCHYKVNSKNIIVTVKKKMTFTNGSGNDKWKSLISYK